MRDEHTRMLDDAEQEIRWLRREREILSLVYTARERGVLFDRIEPNGKTIWRVRLDAAKDRWREFETPESYRGVPRLSGWLRLSLEVAIGI